MRVAQRGGRYKHEHRGGVMMSVFECVVIVHHAEHLLVGIRRTTRPAHWPPISLTFIKIDPPLAVHDPDAHPRAAGSFRCPDISIGVPDHPAELWRDVDAEFPALTAALHARGPHARATAEIVVQACVSLPAADRRCYLRLVYAGLDKDIVNAIKPSIPESLKWEITEDQRATIEASTDEGQLDGWLRRLFHVDTPEALLAEPD